MDRGLTGQSIAIVGGGVIGLAIAKRALASGAAVTLFDRAVCGSGASRAASGIVTLGLRGPNRSEIVGGLEAGDEVALFPPEQTVGEGQA